jgi:hypothetical protein
MKKIFALLLIPLALSCVKDPLPPTPIGKILPERPIAITVDGLLEKEINYNPSDTSISQIINSQSTNPNPIEFEYDNNGILIGWGRSTVNYTYRFFHHTPDSTEMMAIDDITGDTIQVGYKTIIRYDNSKRVRRIVEYTNGRKSASIDYTYDTIDNISKVTLKKFSTTSMYLNNDYFPTYDTILNPFYYEKNHFISTYFISNNFFFLDDYVGGSKYCPKSVEGPTRTEFTNTFEYDHINKRISKVINRSSNATNTTVRIIELIY